VNLHYASRTYWPCSRFPRTQRTGFPARSRTIFPRTFPCCHRVQSIQSRVVRRAGRGASACATAPEPFGHDWQLQATLPGTIIPRHDFCFALHRLRRRRGRPGLETTNGGKAWSEIFNLGYPYYFYGVSALTADDIVVSASTIPQLSIA